jgi:hypothetical protein
LEWADDGTITVRCYESPSYDNVALSGSAEISATDTTFMSGGLGFGADTTYPTTSIREWDYVQKKVPPVVVDETASTQSTAFSPSATTETGAGTDATPTQTSTFTEREGAETAVTTDSVSVQTTAVSPVQGEVVGVAADATVAESITLSPAVTVEAPVGSDTAATTAAQFTPGQTTDSATTTQDTLKTTLTYMPSFGDVRPIAGAVAQTVPLDVSPQAGADTATTDLPAEPTPAAFIPTVTADAGITGLSSPTQSVVLMTPDGDVEGVVDASASAQSFPVGVVGGAETGLATDHTTSTPWAVTIPPGVEFIPRWSMLGTNYAVLHSNGANSLVLHD